MSFLSPLSGLTQEINTVFDEVTGLKLTVTGVLLGRYASIHSPCAERAAKPFPSIRMLLSGVSFHHVRERRNDPITAICIAPGEWPHSRQERGEVQFLM